MFLAACRVSGGKDSLMLGVEGLECYVKKGGLYSGAVRSCEELRGFFEHACDIIRVGRSVEAGQ